MVSFHNFKSRNFKLSVLNPKNKYVAYLSVLSQISNCQSLGRKNKHEILKTDRSLLVTFPSTELQPVFGAGAGASERKRENCFSRGISNSLAKIADLIS